MLLKLANRCLISGFLLFAVASAEAGQIVGNASLDNGIWSIDTGTELVQYTFDSGLFSSSPEPVSVANTGDLALFLNSIGEFVGIGNHGCSYELIFGEACGHTGPGWTRGMTGTIGSWFDYPFLEVFRFEASGPLTQGGTGLAVIGCDENYYIGEVGSPTMAPQHAIAMATQFGGCGSEYPINTVPNLDNFLASADQQSPSALFVRTIDNSIAIPEPEATALILCGLVILSFFSGNNSWRFSSRKSAQGTA